MMCCQDTKTTVSNYTIKIEEFYPSTKKLKKKKNLHLSFGEDIKPQILKILTSFIDSTLLKEKLHHTCSICDHSESHVLVSLEISCSEHTLGFQCIS